MSMISMYMKIGGATGEDRYTSQLLVGLNAIDHQFYDIFQATTSKVSAIIHCNIPKTKVTIKFQFDQH